MGLDFSHSNAHWSYSGFYDFRRRLAQEINVDLEMMDGFGGDIPFDLIKDSIEPLLNHSDCGGGLTPSAVSYTHLRAHETRHDLVCRLLLEKKKKLKKNIYGQMLHEVNTEHKLLLVTIK